VNAVTVFSPAKLNLFLAITGRRTDGFHDLLSLAVPLAFGDTLRAEERARAGGPEAGGRFTLECDDPAVPGVEGFLVLRAARAFAAASGWTGEAHFVLTKRIPLGAGLGGGSSNAVAALTALNRLADAPLGPTELAEVAAGLGSDCPLFLAGGPVTMRGRGERVAPIHTGATDRLIGRKVMVFKPGVGVDTAWAYRQMAKRATASYLPVAESEARLEVWLKSPDAPAEALLYNGMEGPVFAKFIVLPVLVDLFRAEFGLEARMTGSGSACFALLAPGAPIDAIARRIRSILGEEAFVVETTIG
jgi:4-diphosphocytidyl-2-C-methyl-D-erythritol kinase